MDKEPSQRMIKNIFTTTGIPFAKDQEQVERLCSGEGLFIERIISRGQVSDPGHWYDQDRHEWVLLLTGKASLQFENGQLLHLSGGDYLLLPAGLKHRVAYTSKDRECIWLAVHFITPEPR